MIRRFTRYLLVSASSLVAAVVMLPAGCIFGGSSNCLAGSRACADEHTELVCMGGEGQFHFSPKPCDPQEHCESSPLDGEGSCTGAREGGSCLTRQGCAASPLCLAGKCAPLPPAVVSACSAAVVIDAKTLQDAPDGVTFATSFEPGPPVVSPVLALDTEESPLSVRPCGAKAAGPERVLTINVPTSPENPEGVEVVVTIEGLDSTAVSAVAGLAFETCGDPRTSLASSCAPSGGELVLHAFFRSNAAAVFSVILQSTGELTKSVPFTVRARVASLNAN